MATRVKKLAKELGRTPEEILGMLHALGFPRYRSVDDQLPKAMVERVKGGWRKGVVPVAFVLGEQQVSSSKRAEKKTATQEAGDWMQSALPGVKPLDAESEIQGGAKRSKPPSAKKAGAVKSATLKPDPSNVEPKVFERHKKQSEAIIAHLTQRVEQLEREALESSAKRQELEAANTGLLTALNGLRGRRPGLIEVCARRGITGTEQIAETLAGLIQKGLVGDLLPLLRVDNEEHWVRHLHRHVLLLPQGKGAIQTELVQVQVDPAKADLTDPRETVRLVQRLSGQMLLFGVKSVVVVGPGDGLGRLVEELMDRRIQWHHFVLTEGTEKQVLDMAKRVDALLVWNTRVSRDIVKTYRSAKRPVVIVKDGGLGALVEGVCTALKE